MIDRERYGPRHGTRRIRAAAFAAAVTVITAATYLVGVVVFEIVEHL